MILVLGAACSTPDRAVCKAIQAVLCSSKQRRLRHDDVHRQRAHRFLESSLGQLAALSTQLLKRRVVLVVHLISALCNHPVEDAEQTTTAYSFALH